MHTLGSFKFLVLTGHSPQSAREAEAYYTKFPELTVTTQNHQLYISRPEGVGVAYATFICSPKGVLITGDQTLSVSTPEQLKLSLDLDSYFDLNKALIYTDEHSNTASLVISSMLDSIRYRVKPSIDPILLSFAMRRPDPQIDSYLRTAYKTLTLDDFYRLLRFNTADVNNSDKMPMSVGIWLKYVNLDAADDFRFTEDSLYKAIHAGIPQGLFHHLNYHRSKYSKSITNVARIRLPRTTTLVHGTVESGKEVLLGCSASLVQAEDIVTQFDYQAPRLHITLIDGELRVDLNFPSITKAHRTKVFYEVGEISNVDLVSKLIEVFNSFGILALSFFVVENLNRLIAKLREQK